MKIESFFKRQAKAPGEECNKAKRLKQETPQAKDVARSDDRGDPAPTGEKEAPRASGPLLDCTNGQVAERTPSASPKVKKQPVDQGLQAIDLCDDGDDPTPEAAAGLAATPAPPPAPAPAAEAASMQTPQQLHQPMDVDMQPVDTPAEGVEGNAATAATGNEFSTPAPASAPAAGTTPGTTAVKSTVTKAAATETFLTPEQRKELLKTCQEELPLLEAELGLRLDLSGHLDGDKKALELKHQVSILVEGQSLPLTEVAEHISTTLRSRSSSNGAAGDPGSSSGPAADGAAPEAATAAAGAGPSALVVRNLIQEVASRKSYGLQDGALANVDALEDATPAYHWCWELRSLVGLPKAVKQQVDAARKHRKQVLDRLKAASVYVQLAQSFTKSTKAAESKLARAAGKLSKLPALEVLQQQYQAAVEAAAHQQGSTVKSKSTASKLDKQAKEEQEALAKAEKQRRSDEEKAAKEAEKAAKEAEKAAKAAAKAAEAAEKARLKAEKEAERELKRAQKAQEQAKKAAQTAKQREAAEAAKAGFGSATGLHKAQNTLKSFFGVAAQRMPSPSGGDGSQGAGSQMDGGSGSTKEASKDASKDVSKDASRLWAVAAGPTKQQVFKMQLLEQELPYFSSSTGDAAEAVADLLQTLQQHWREVRSKHMRIWGLPPSWAQRPGVAGDPEHVKRAAAVLYGEGVDVARLRCWRRKLIKHWDSVRPPFYGSIPRQSSGQVSGRHPLAKDIELDYEVMSDQDWEEEPEGESLSADEADGEEEGVEEGDEDEEGFVVGDGYLSEDEGMRDEDEPGGDDGSQLVGAGCAATTSAAAGSSGSSSSTSLSHLEAVLEHARARGRPVVLVNNCPEMTWEPTTQLQPSILCCLKGRMMRSDVTATPVTAADLPHLFGSTLASAAAAAAATGSAAGHTAAGADGSVQHETAAATGEAGARPPSGARGRTASVFPQSLLPALVQLVHNSTTAMDQLVKQFVETQAAAGVKVAKARIKDKIKEISSMRMVAKAPLYTVKPEVLQAVGQGDATAAEAPAEAEAGGVQDMDADDAGPCDAGQQQQGQQQEQQQQHVQEPAQAAGQAEEAHPAATSGVKRPASEATPIPHQQQQQDKDEDAATAGPPSKKHRTPASASGGIQRFFTAAKASKAHKPAAAVPTATAAMQVDKDPQQNEEQQQQQQGTPPSTPNRKSLQQQPEVPDTVTAGNGTATAAATAAAAAADGADYSGALPMLTPPSDAAAEDRPNKGPHSPVPFRLNRLNSIPAADARAPAANADAAAGSKAAEQQPQQQQQPGRQQIAKFFKRRPQQQVAEPEKIGRTGQSQPSTTQQNPAAAAAAAAGGGYKSAEAHGNGGHMSPPPLPADGSVPSSSFWKQLAHWIVAVREPSAADIEAAFRVFDEQNLLTCIHNMPQVVLSAMVKTLGSSSQSFRMRSACARCISNAVQGMVLHEKLQLQQQQDVEQADHPAAALSNSPAAGSMHRQGTSPPAAAAAGASDAGAGSRSPLQQQQQGQTASPSPSASPRSAPVEASFEELCAEPRLLPNLLLCLNPEKSMEAARAAAAAAGGSGAASSSSGGGSISVLGPDAAEQADDLARNASRAVCRLVLVGVPLPQAAGNVLSLQPCSSATAAAAGRFRLQLASVSGWRGILRMIVRTSEDVRRTTFALMALFGLLSDPAAASQYICKQRMAAMMFTVLAARGSKDEKWVVQKWCLLVLSTMLSDSTLREWTLPVQDPLQPLQQGVAEILEALEALATLLAKCICKPKEALSQPDSPDRALLDKALQLCSTLADFIACHQRMQSTLPPWVVQLFDSSNNAGQGQGDDCCLAQALQGVAGQQECDEAAAWARQLLGDAATAADGVDGGQ